MLTKQDLQSIADILDDRLEAKVPGMIEALVPKIIERMVPPMIEAAIEKTVPTMIESIVEKKLAPIRKDIQYLKRRVDELHRDINVVIDHFDRRLIALSKRMTRVELHLGLTPLAVDKL